MRSRNLIVLKILRNFKYVQTPTIVAETKVRGQITTYKLPSSTKAAEESTIGRLIRIRYRAAMIPKQSPDMRPIGVSSKLIDQCRWYGFAP